MIIDMCEQGSDLWFAAKLGKPSASNAGKIITTTGKQSKQREDYLNTLVAERITGQRADSFKSEAMEMGNEREEESRKLYEMTHDVEVEQVGVIYKDEEKQILCSPDGIINRTYGLELKNVLGKTQVGRLRKGTLPTEYIGQIQWSLYVTGFEFWVFCSYAPGLKPLIIKVERDEEYITALEKELVAFCKDLSEITEKIR